MIDWYSLGLAMGDALVVLVASCVIAFVLDAFVLGALDGMKGGE